MIRFPSTYAFAALLCVTLFFSCTANIELLPPVQTDEQSSSSDIEFQTDESSSSSYTEPLPPPQSNASSSSSDYTPPSDEPSSSTIFTPSSSSMPSSSSKPTSTTGGCQENNPKAGFACAWNATGILTPGTILKPGAYTMPSDCQSVEWKYADDNSDMALMYGCMATDENGFISEGSKNYVLFAELTCSDGKHTTACNPKTGLPSKLAPELKGECAWAKNPTTTARGGTPSGVSVVDTDNICGATKSVVYKYDGGTKTWPSTGIVEAGTYSDVEATLNCPAYSEPVTIPCPPLEVKAGADYI